MDDARVKWVIDEVARGLCVDRALVEAALAATGEQPDADDIIDVFERAEPGNFLFVRDLTLKEVVVTDEDEEAKARRLHQKESIASELQSQPDAKPEDGQAQTTAQANAASEEDKKAQGSEDAQHTAADGGGRKDSEQSHAAAPNITVEDNEPDENKGTDAGTAEQQKEKQQATQEEGGLSKDTSASRPASRSRGSRQSSSRKGVKSRQGSARSKRASAKSGRSKSARKKGSAHGEKQDGGIKEDGDGDDDDDDDGAGQDGSQTDLTASTKLKTEIVEQVSVRVEINTVPPTACASQAMYFFKLSSRELTPVKNEEEAERVLSKELEFGVLGTNSLKVLTNVRHLLLCVCPVLKSVGQRGERTSSCFAKERKRSREVERGREVEREVEAHTFTK